MHGDLVMHGADTDDQHRPESCVADAEEWSGDQRVAVADCDDPAEVVTAVGARLPIWAGAACRELGRNDVSCREHWHRRH